MVELISLEFFKDIIKFVFHTEKPEFYIYSFIVITIAGFIGIIHRYIFHSKKSKEVETYLKLDIGSKLIISLIVGLSAFIFALSINFLINTIFENKDFSSIYSLQNVFILIITFALPFNLRKFKNEEKKPF